MGGGGGGGGGGSGGQWEGSWWGVRVDVNEIEVFVKIQKKKLGGGGVGGGVRVDVNEELKFL